MVTNFIVWMFVGGLIGWAVSRLWDVDNNQGDLFHVIIGVVGASLAGLLISPLLGISSFSQTTFSFGALVVSALGAVLLLIGVHYFRRRKLR